ncbi:MAG: phosphoadenylyl-sulfate reductase [Candidatus Coatesbacteria bacterium]
MTVPDEAALARWRVETGGLPAEEILGWAVAAFPGRVGFSSSLGLEDQVLADMIAARALPVRAFTLDTGRLFPETLDLLARTEARYGLGMRVFLPDAVEVEALVNTHGVDLFRRSPGLRQACCEARKVHPLKRALAGLEAWICGLRAGQSSSRADVHAVDWDAGNGLVRISPLAAWTGTQVDAYVRDHDVPVNPLHATGFPSIGCAPCTRAVAPGGDPRSGRWWWEAAGHRECGLHRVAGPGEGRRG